ncbi:hypothetical protein [Methanohalophilus sp.]
MEASDKVASRDKETTEWLKRFTTGGGLVVCGLLWTESKEKQSVTLSVIGERIDPSNDDKYVVVSSFPLWNGDVCEYDRFDLEGGIAKWVIEVWERKDTDSTVVWYTFEVKNRPDVMKFPGDWKLTAQLWDKALLRKQ